MKEVLIGECINPAGKQKLADALEDKALFNKLWSSLLDLLIVLYHRRIEVLHSTKEYGKLLYQAKRFLKIKNLPE